MSNECVFQSAYCETCIDVKVIQTSPPIVDSSKNKGWGIRGANSIDVLDGSFHVVFYTGPGTLGAIVGFRSPRDVNMDPALIEHALYAQLANGARSLEVREFGVRQAYGFSWNEGDKFEVKRVGKYVKYLQNDVVIYASFNPSLGPKLVTGCLYSFGDSIL